MKLLTGLACAFACMFVAAPARAADPALDLERLSVADAQSQMAAGRLTSVQLTRAYINRIAATNSRGPGLNAVRMLNPRALQDAALLDLERATGHMRGPLHGIPVLVKDNLDATGMPTTAGSVALESSIPDRDSAVVAKLRAAGAVILGKTNLTEFANFISSTSLTGYSSLGGQVLNPYDISVSPSGSSSGSAAAAAAGLTMVTIGTETSGSIVSPSAAQGDVGLRPTVGLVSRTGIVPISATQDTAGPITRTVADAAAELQAIAGKDPEDPATGSAPATVPDYLAGLTTTALQGKRIGIITTGNLPAQYTAAVAAIQGLGATTVPVAAPQSSSVDILTREFKRDLNAYLARLPAGAPMKTLQDIIDYNAAHADEALKFGQGQLIASQATDLTDPAQQAQYQTDRAASVNNARTAIDTTLTTNNLDAIMTPSGTMTGIGARAGYPQLVVPAGYGNTRLPVGIAFNGTAYREATLLAFGYAYEQATKLRQPVSFVNPAVWRCTPGSAFGPRSCGPGRELLAQLGTVPNLPFSLETASVADLQARMTGGTLSAVDLTKAYLARIARTNLEGPSLDALRALNPKALQEAAAMDAERAAGHVRGPLHGIPVIVKDNLDSAGMPTTAGSVALESSIPDRDSTVVAKLRAAGAILLGKANLSEFANFLTNGMPSGYSSLGGQVLNPTDASTTPSGSSSGSGAGAASGLATITIGTETSGSITSPSAAQGIVGLRPTIGLVSRTGIIPISATQDTAGPMTRTVADAAAELQAIAGKDPEDPQTATAPDTVPDYVAGLTTTALQGKRIGLLTVNNPSPQYTAAVAAVQALGATTVQIATPQSSAPDILTPEFKRDMNAYLARLPASAPMKTLHDIRLYNDAHAQEALKFGQTQVIASDNTDLTDPAQLATYTANRAASRGNARTAIDTALTSNNLDAIMTPATTLTAIGARAGYPQLVVPAGYSATTRNPVGIAFNGSAYSEGKLLAFGYAFEQATHLRKPPSETNPSLWRCVPGNAYIVARGSCAPGETANADVVAAPVGGTVPATLALALGPPASFGGFVPGIDKEYTASTTASVISTAASANLSVSDPGHLTNGAFSLPEALRVEIAPNAWSLPVSNATAAITFRQHIGAADALRTGSYSKTLTFALSTTEP